VLSGPRPQVDTADIIRSPFEALRVLDEKSGDFRLPSQAQIYGIVILPYGERLGSNTSSIEIDLNLYIFPLILSVISSGFLQRA
jgi:hypothetical protein